MKKTIVVGAALLLLGTFSSTSQATPASDNPGQCVKASEQPSGKYGRSEAAKACTARSSSPAPLECVENGNVDVDEGANTVTVSGYDNPDPAQYDGSSLECSASIPVSAGDSISFDYTFGAGTAPCGGGVPRMFVVIDGSYYNTFDDDPNECDSATGSYTLPVGGTVTQVGLVYDRDYTGSVTYSNVKVGTQTLDF